MMAVLSAFPILLKHLTTLASGIQRCTCWPPESLWPTDNSGLLPTVPTSERWRDAAGNQGRELRKRRLALVLKVGTQHPIVPFTH